MRSSSKIVENGNFKIREGTESEKEISAYGVEKYSLGISSSSIKKKNEWVRSPKKVGTESTNIIQFRDTPTTDH